MGQGLQDEPEETSTNRFAEVWAIVRSIPEGSVMNYGQIAGQLKRKLSARAVGWAMNGCPDDVPWHRVVNAKGRCSTDHRSDLPPGFQRHLLEEEGVEFDLSGKIDLPRFRFKPPEDG